VPTTFRLASFHGPFYGFDHVSSRATTRRVARRQHYALWMEEKVPETGGVLRPEPPRQTVREIRYRIFDKETGTGKAWDIPKRSTDTWIAERQRPHGRVPQRRELFLWAKLFDPHPRYMVPEPYASMYDPARVTVPDHPGARTTSRPIFA